MFTAGSLNYSEPSGLRKLPKELLLRILEFCGLREILRFSATCRAYLDLVTSSARLRLQIELDANGLQRLSNGVQSNELLEKLIKRRDKWLDLRLDAGGSLPRTTSGQRFTLWELRDGIFASAFFMGEFRHLEANAIKIITLDPPMEDWTLPFDFTFHELTIDPMQDLLVLAIAEDFSLHTLYIRFCSLKTGLAHPSAKLGILPIQLAYSVKPHHIYSTVSLVISDELLLVSLISHDVDLCYDVLVWDWHAGTHIMRTGWRPGLCGATCLDHDRFIVFESVIPGTEEEELTEADALNLLIYDMSRARGSRDEVRNDSLFVPSEYHPCEPTLQLAFPPLGLSVRVLSTDFLLRTAPISSFAASHRQELLPDPAFRTISLSMRLLIGEVSATFLVFIDASRLFTYLAQAQTEAQTFLPWDDWGEYSTRWVRYNSDPNPWINWLHGTRYVLGRQVMDDQPEVQDNPYLAIADFHTLIVRRFRTRTASNYITIPTDQVVCTLRQEAIKQGRWAFFGNYLKDTELQDGQLVVDVVEADTPTIIEDLGPSSIVSRLPYRLVVSRPAQSVWGCSDWMIDDNRIVGIGPNPETGQFGDLITIQSIQP